MQGTPLPHRLVAVWFADVAGYSARAAEDESGALQLIEILQALSRETVGRYDGRIVKFIGDAVLAEFPSTDLAVRAAAALSRDYVKQSIATGHPHSLTVRVAAVGLDCDACGSRFNVAGMDEEE